MPKDQPTPISDKRTILANVALLYYGEGLTQGDIARRMRVSRATIVNMLREARESGIVDIRVEGSSLTTSSLASDLCKKYDLEDVYVAYPCAKGQTVNRADMLRQLGRVGAIALTEIAHPGDRIGVAWGETIRAVSDHMPRKTIDGVSVFQMIGSMISESVPNSEGSTIEIANMLGAECFTLHAPALASSPEIASVFMAEPTIRRQLDFLSSLDMTVASIGHVRDETHLARAQMATIDELKAARAAGAVGILCCRYIAADGSPVDLPPDNRLIATQLDDILRAKRRLLIVGGVNRLEATMAAIRGGYVSHLCVDDTLAEALVSSAG